MVKKRKNVTLHVSNVVVRYLHHFLDLFCQNEKWNTVIGLQTTLSNIQNPINSYPRIMQSVLEPTLSIYSSLILPHFASQVELRLVGYKFYTLNIMYFMLHKICKLSRLTTIGNFRRCSFSSVSRVRVQALACSCQLCMGGPWDSPSHRRMPYHMVAYASYFEMAQNSA